MSDLTKFFLAREGFKPFVLEGDLVPCKDLEGHDGAVPQYLVAISDGEYTYVLEDVAFVPEPTWEEDYCFWSDAKGKAQSLVDKIKQKGKVNLLLWTPFSQV